MVHTYINKPQNIQYFCFFVIGVASWSGGVICVGCGCEPGKEGYEKVIKMGGKMGKASPWREALMGRVCAFEAG
ncbi:hypothetical protein ABU162_27635 [Paenibacillus thiaminolyticus]|uniref:hypothetical protein n=1 Tax=Paenibacillus thiaminolyticus TaxID=49283 RepID=UPI0035A57492